MTSSPRTVSPVSLPPLQPLSPFPFCPSLGFLGRRLMPRRVSLGAEAGRFAGHAGRRWSCPSSAGMAGRVPLRRLLSMSGHPRAMKVGDGISSVVFVVLAQMVASQHPSPYGRGTDLIRHWTRLALAPPSTKRIIAPGKPGRDYAFECCGLWPANVGCWEFVQHLSSKMGPILLIRLLLIRSSSLQSALIEIMVPRGGFEPPTPAFSVPCSTRLSYLG